MASKEKDQTSTGTPGLGGLGSNPTGALSQVDPALNDVTGKRKPSAPGAGGNTVSDGEKKNSLRINIELDLEVEIHLTARVKGDITIGLL
ncbi:hypothetical protein M409DRAFT_19335 [Zasmidium cellare ATCC 36951]|uniref:Uncharacterized protein n=1 Tax=Zasmidium cellare ATCC 36951 TaxID=1080233 RepID=A0A6A6CTY9_ZASCE|nr:uncharacterized protein M409DRAFT_19335 [Zasmidium cellare ATCC 36951]KAF2170515.1 hypothetical protein M409DRAFT_19335 [Zasmidium cellare ATCC 36951]